MKYGFILFLLPFLNSCLKKADIAVVDYPRPIRILVSNNAALLKVDLNKDTCRLFEPKKVSCSKRSADNWLRRISKIKVNQEMGVMPSNPKFDFVKIESATSNTYIQMFDVDNACFVNIRETKNKNQRLVLGQISKTACEDLKITPDKLIDTRLLSSKIFSISYQIKNKNVQLDEQKTKLIENQLLKAKFLKFVYLGDVNSGVLKANFIEQNKNNNVLGTLLLNLENQKVRLKFGKPIEGSAVTNIWIEGQQNITQFEINGWPKIQEALSQNKL